MNTEESKEQKNSLQAIANANQDALRKAVKSIYTQLANLGFPDNGLVSLYKGSGIEYLTISQTDKDGKQFTLTFLKDTKDGKRKPTTKSKS